MASMVSKLSTLIKQQWRRGWVEIPVVMANMVLTVPLTIFVFGYSYVQWDIPEPTEKYRIRYTVIRPDDPRVHTINHKSRIDKTGFLMPQFPIYHNT